MALLTEDIELAPTDGWTAIVLTGTVIHITDVRKNKILYRFGIGSTSKGTELTIGESISIDETIYVRTFTNSSGNANITVNKD